MAKLQIRSNSISPQMAEIRIDGKPLPVGTYKIVLDVDVDIITAHISCYVDEIDIDAETKLCLTKQER